MSAEANPVTLPLPEKQTPQSLLVPQLEVPDLLGVSRSAFFRLKSLASFPAPVKVPGSGIAYRRADLERWVNSLKPDRAPRRRPPKRPPAKG